MMGVNATNDTENTESNIPDASKQQKTLLDFFKKPEAADELSDTRLEPPNEPSSRDCQWTLVQHTLDRQISGKLHPWAAACLFSQYVTNFKERHVLDVFPSGQPILSTSYLPDRSGSLLCARFDSTGELLATGGDDGLLLLHNRLALQSAFKPNIQLNYPFSQSSSSTSDQFAPALNMDPLLAIQTQLPKVHSVRWNPSDENIIGVASMTCRFVSLYDLQRTRGEPKQTFTAPAVGGAGSGDLAFFNAASGSPVAGGGYTLLIGGAAGQAYLWDTRGSASPACTLQSGTSARAESQVISVEVLDGNYTVMAGTQGGDIKIWDVRGGRGGALRFGGVPHVHPLLAWIPLRGLLGKVPGLTAQAGTIPASSVDCMEVDPKDCTRLAFHLACGWSGVVDVLGHQVTHVHAPPRVQAQLHMAEPANDLPSIHTEDVSRIGSAAPSAGIADEMACDAPRAYGRRRGSWTPDGRRFIIPSRFSRAICLLDFEPSMQAGCAVGGASNEWDGSDAGDDRRVAPCHGVELTQYSRCTAASPDGSNMFVAGGAWNRLSVVEIS